MTRTLIIGDIHGCYDELRDLLEVAAVAADDVVVSVGDLVDRGPGRGRRGDRLDRARPRPRLLRSGPLHPRVQGADRTHAATTSVTR